MQAALFHYFASRQFRDLPAIMSHVGEISSTISKSSVPKRKPGPARSYSDFTKLVLRLAPSFFNGQYQRRAISREVLRLQGVERPSWDEIKTMQSRVSDSLQSLKERNFLKKTTDADRLLPPALREVSSADIVAHSHLLTASLNVGMRFNGRVIKPNWKAALTRDEAMSIARTALARALAIYNPAKGCDLKYYVRRRIIAELNRATNKALKQRERSLDEPLHGVDERHVRTLHDVIGEPSSDPESFDTDLDLMYKHKVPVRHIAVWMLRFVYDHQQEEVAKFFGVSRQAVQQVEKAACRKLETAKGTLSREE